MKTHTTAWMGLAVLAAALVSCRQADLRTVRIDVPQMSDARAVRIVTNAALDAVIGQYDGLQHECHVALAKGLVFYHESPRLADKAYQRRIEARLAEVGYPGQVLAVGRNPPPPVDTVRGPRQMWPDRVTAVIRVPTMHSAREANIIVDAIAYARLGGDSPAIVADPQARALLVRYNSQVVALRNLEYAIASVGYQANATAADLGLPEPLPDGWTPALL